VLPLGFALLLALPAVMTDEAREALAASSPRWPACAVEPARKAARLWVPERSGRLAQACERLAFGYAMLEEAPARSLRVAEERLGLASGVAEPELGGAWWVLAGQALVRLQRAEEAWAYFKRFQASGGRLKGARVLADFALAGQKLGQNAGALAALTLASGQMAQLGPNFRQRVYLEAGALSILENRLSQATGLLDLARREPGAIEQRALARALLATALEIQGKTAQAASVRAEIADIWALVAGPLTPSVLSPAPVIGRRQPYIQTALASAVSAVLLFKADPKESQVLFRALKDDPAASQVLRNFAAVKLGSR